MGFFLGFKTRHPDKKVHKCIFLQYLSLVGVGSDPDNNPASRQGHAARWHDGTMAQWPPLARCPMARCPDASLEGCPMARWPAPCLTARASVGTMARALPDGAGQRGQMARALPDGAGQRGQMARTRWRGHNGPRSPDGGGHYGLRAMACLHKIPKLPRRYKYTFAGDAGVCGGCFHSKLQKPLPHGHTMRVEFLPETLKRSPAHTRTPPQRCIYTIWVVWVEGASIPSG
jgi:hypothetical protein